MTVNAPALTSRFEGRLFSENGRLYFVLDIDPASGVARVSCRGESGQQVIEMPISEIGLRLATSGSLQLDGLNTSETSNRITKLTDGWFFTTREGPNGPFRTEAEADLALSKYILSVQRTATSSVRERDSVSAE